MATHVYTVEEVTLLDGKEVTLRPLSIKNLRKFMKMWKEIEKVEDEDQTVDFIIDVARFCLGTLYPEYDDSDKFEDALEIQTVHKIIEICGGIKLNDPELMAAAMAAAAQEQTGKI